uniref:Protein kinase domain-containing protein n=1 Tax=Angiostrongylus cantonensis TaxID=6313 RepID=A0A0K0D9P7_ANGCA
MRDELRRHQNIGGSDEPQCKFNETPFDSVFDIVVNKVTGEEFAAKFIKKRRYATSRRGVTRANIEREVLVLRLVGGHSNVIELHEVYETPSDVILVLELVSGGELFDHVCARECLDEVEAAAFVRQILLGLKHLHSLNIVHLDIKPENVMLKKRGDSQVKLIDFGLSRLIRPGHSVKDMVGTPEFVAPEVVNYEALSPATDMWALGVVTYILLSGGSPFLGDTRDETFCNITGVNYHFSERVSFCCGRHEFSEKSLKMTVVDW